jgi:hypothetical protein
MVDQRILKADGTEGFFIALFSILFIFFSYILVKEFLEHLSILKLLTTFIWIIACIVQIYLQSIKLLNSKSENTLDNQDKYQVSTKIQQLIGTIIAFILGILLLVLLREDVYIYFFNPQTLLVSQPEYEPFNYYSNMALGMAIIIDNLMDLFNIKKSLSKSILSLFKVILYISSLVMYFVYAVHLTEVNL